MSTGADARLAPGPEAALAALAAPTHVAAGRHLSVGTLALTGGLLVLAAVWMIPLLWILMTAIKPEPEITRLPVHVFPEEVTLANVAAALTTSRTANIAVA